MHSLLVIALLLTLCSAPTAATSPLLDPTLPSAPMESFYQDPEGLLSNMCTICGPVQLCIHMWNPPVSPDISASTLLHHPEWPGNNPSFSSDMEELSDIFIDSSAYMPPSSAPNATQPLSGWHVDLLNEDAVTISSETVGEHLKDIYTPGDRTRPRPGSRQQSNRRQQPRPGGFPCNYDGCGKSYDRSCDLNRHQKTHLDRAARPHKCSFCEEGFLYPKDRLRHERKHNPSWSHEGTSYCQVPGCDSTKGFSRTDNLRRHQRKKHPWYVSNH